MPLARSRRWGPPANHTDRRGAGQGRRGARKISCPSNSAAAGRSGRETVHELGPPRRLDRADAAAGQPGGERPHERDRRRPKRTSSSARPWAAPGRPAFGTPGFMLKPAARRRGGGRHRGHRVLPKRAEWDTGFSSQPSTPPGRHSESGHPGNDSSVIPFRSSVAQSPIPPAAARSR